MLATKNKLSEFVQFIDFFWAFNGFFQKTFNNLCNKHYFFNFYNDHCYYKITFRSCKNLKIFIIFENCNFLEKTIDFLVSNCQKLEVFIFCKDSHQQNANFKFFLKKKSEIFVNFLYFSKSSKNNFYFFIDHLGNETKSKVNIVNFCQNVDHLSVICISRIQKKFTGCKLLQDIKSFNLQGNNNIKNLPILDIQNFDNFSNHGCVIGDISLDLYQYFLSKGISRAGAANLIYKSVVVSFLKNINEINLETIFYNNFYLNAKLQ